MDLKTNQTYLGDCLELMADMEDNSIDALICDLPYGTTRCKWDSVINLEDFWFQAHRVVKDDGAIVLTCQAPFTIALGYSNIKNLKYTWVWEKNIATGHLNAKKAPMKAHEDVLVFYKRLPVYNPQMTSGHKKTSTRVTKKEDMNKSGIYGKMTKDVIYKGTDKRYPRSVQRWNRDKNGFHPTQKPLDMWRYLIRTYTNEGDTVLDCTCGSGTTGRAALDENRKYIQMEMTPLYWFYSKIRAEETWEEDDLTNLSEYLIDQYAAIQRQETAQRIEKMQKHFRSKLRILEEEVKDPQILSAMKGINEYLETETTCLV